MHQTPLNPFQGLMRQWDAMHPYNALQIARVQGPVDRSRAEEAWRSTLVELGIGHAAVRAGGWIIDSPATPDGVRLAHSENPGLALDDLVTLEINRRFDEAAESPFRAFVSPTTEGKDSLLGISYHHWAADSVTVRRVLGEWFLRLFDPGRSLREPMRPAQRGDQGWAAASAGSWRGAVATARWLMRFRRCRRLKLHPPDLSVRFAFRPSPPDLASRMLAAARACDASVNDLLLAALARTAARNVVLRGTGGRDLIGLGEIIDLRAGDAPRAGPEPFGMLLGFAALTCRHQDIPDPRRLVASFAALHGKRRAVGGRRGDVLLIRAALALGRMTRPDKLIRRYQGGLPLAGGLSNVNMNRTWLAPYHPAPLLEYIRVSPAGPLLPLVVAATTLGSNTSLGVTYREFNISRGKRPRIAEEFQRQLGLVLDAC